jgi:hypothetical protein
MTTTTMTSVNGIDIEALAQATDAMKMTPRLAALQFRSVTDWKDGAVSVTTFAGYAKGETGVTRSKPHTRGRRTAGTARYGHSGRPDGPPAARALALAGGDDRVHSTDGRYSHDDETR